MRSLCREPITATRCFCHCHTDPDPCEPAPFGQVQPVWPPSVERVDALGAATACDRCQPFHCLALSGRPPELDARPKWNPPSLVEAVVAPEPPVKPQADGHADG